MLELICKELGVEIGEEWEGNDSNYYKINKKGKLKMVVYFDDLEESVFEYEADISKILTGELKPKWKPVNGEKYYAPDIIYTKKYTPSVWGDRILDYWRLENGLVFKTKEEAIECAVNMIELAKHGI